MSKMDFLKDALRDSVTLKEKQYLATQLIAQRSQHISNWKLLAKYIYPWRGRFDDEGTSRDGKRKDTVLVDSYPVEAFKKCSAGLHSGLTSPSRPWFKLSLQDKEKAEWYPVRAWLDSVEDVLMSMYARSNTYKMLYEHEAEMPLFGTSACMMVEDSEYGIWHTPFTCGEYAGGVDARGRVSVFYRRFELDARQMVGEFGKDNVSEHVLNAYRSNNVTLRFRVNMLIERNIDYKPYALKPGNFPWRSWYWEDGQTDRFLKISGYHEQPFMMPRWEVVANGVYGIGLGDNNIGNCMQLQKLEKVKLRSGDNSAMPAMMFPAGAKKVDMSPGAINFAPEGAAIQAYPLVPPGSKPYDGILMFTQEKRQQIAAGFYNDLMIMLSQQNGNPDMTAREVAERHEEKLLMLGPVLEQFHNEVLEVLTLRSFGIGMRNGFFPPPPEEVTKDELKVNFISLLAQAQQLVDMPAITNTIGIAGNLAGIAPDIMDNIDTDEVIRQVATINGAPAKILRSSETVEDIRKKREEAQAEAMQAERMMQAAGPTQALASAAKTMSETSINGRNALEQMLGGVGYGR